MGLLKFFNKWRKPAEPFTTVPPGHQVTVYSAAPCPALIRSEGGVLLAHLGTSSDNADIELEKLCAEIGAVLMAPPPDVHIVSGPISLGGILATREPQWAPQPGLLLWTIHRSALVDWASEPVRMRQLLRRLYRTGESQWPGLRRGIFVAEIHPVKDRAIVQILDGLDIPVRTTAREHEVLVEVLRPDGRRCSGCVGDHIALRADERDHYSGHMQRALDRAEELRDAERLRDLLDEDRVQLVQRLGPHPRHVPRRAPRMHRALLAAESDRRTSLLAEIRSRAAPLALLTEPDGRIALPEWPGLGPALPVFSDLDSLFLTAEQTGRAGSFGVTS